MTGPAKLGKYVLLEQIAKGGMAEVFRAKAVGIAGFERILAIKRIRPKLAEQERFVRSFIDEAKIAVSLNHRNIVQVVDFGHDEGELFLVMELIDGVDLRTAVNRAVAADLRIPTNLALYIVAEVAAGLEYAHKRETRGTGPRVVHCDVSPHNIMLSFDGFVKVLDFGVARAEFVVGPKEKRLRGKPRYMAPEQTRGDIPTPATDVFALGIVAWELLTSLRLFEGTDMKSVLKSVRTQSAPRVASLNPDVPEEVSDAIARALHKDPKERGTAADLAVAFSQAAREGATSPLDQGLTDWLTAVFGVREEEPTVRTSMPMYSIDETAEVTSPPSMSWSLPLADVALVTVSIAGGTSGSRAALKRAVEVLAFKQGAIIDPRGELTVFFAPDDTRATSPSEVTKRACYFALDAAEMARTADPVGAPTTEIGIAIILDASAAEDASTDSGDELIQKAQQIAVLRRAGAPVVIGELPEAAKAMCRPSRLGTVTIGGGPTPAWDLVGIATHTHHSDSDTDIEISAESIRAYRAKNKGE